MKDGKNSSEKYLLTQRLAGYRAAYVATQAEDATNLKDKTSQESFSQYLDLLEVGTGSVYSEDVFAEEHLRQIVDLAQKLTKIRASENGAKRRK